MLTLNSRRIDFHDLDLRLLQLVSQTEDKMMEGCFAGAVIWTAEDGHKARVEVVLQGGKLHWLFPKEGLEQGQR